MRCLGELFTTRFNLAYKIILCVEAFVGDEVVQGEVLLVAPRRVAQVPGCHLVRVQPSNMKFKLFESSEPLGARAADVFEKTAVSLDVDRQVVQGRERLRAVVVGADEALLLAVSLLVALELEGGHEAPGAAWVVTLEWLQLKVLHDVQL